MIIFSSVADLRAAHLVEDDVVVLLGESKQGDSTGFFGVIRNTDYVTTNRVERIANGLIAELLPKTSSVPNTEITPKKDYEFIVNNGTTSVTIPILVLACDIHINGFYKPLSEYNIVRDEESLTSTITFDTPIVGDNTKISVAVYTVKNIALGVQFKGVMPLDQIVALTDNKIGDIWVSTTEGEIPWYDDTMRQIAINEGLAWTYMYEENYLGWVSIGLLRGPKGEAGESIIGPQGEQGIQGIRGPQGIQGETGPEGQIGPRGPEGIQGPKGEQGIQGNIGLTPAHQWNGKSIRFMGTDGEWGQFTDVSGVQGIQGPQGVKGSKGDQGEVGPQGKQGVAGPIGPKGNEGDIGPIGPRGDQGPRGPQGMQGIQGVQGPQGKDGTSFKVDEIGTLAERSAFDGKPKGFTYYATDVPNVDGSNGAIYIKESDVSGNWSSPIPFGKGPRGDQGPQGEQGIQGPVGPQGPVGDKGATGDRGQQGIRGPQGLTGEQGPQGPKGEQGEQGLTGNTGLTGPQGEQGIRGPEGPQGKIGPTGAKGPQGDQGLQGATGPQGEQGPEGKRGPIGLQGPEGPQGDRGPQGPQGDIGLPGPVGPQGGIGPTGPQGPQGIKGDTGDKGPNGDAGRSVESKFYVSTNQVHIDTGVPSPGQPYEHTIENFHITGAQPYARNLVISGFGGRILRGGVGSGTQADVEITKKVYKNGVLIAQVELDIEGPDLQAASVAYHFDLPKVIIPINPNETCTISVNYRMQQIGAFGKSSSIYSYPNINSLGGRGYYCELSATGNSFG